jgi:hypothetical protein
MQNSYDTDERFIQYSLVRPAQRAPTSSRERDTGEGITGKEAAL